MPRQLGRDEARRFYDHFGSKQDDQGFYEDRALDRLAEWGDFESARSIVELGCGTGRFGSRLLDVSRGAYRGFDISSTMIDLASKRLERFGSRARASLFDGSMPLDVADQSADRFVSTYVLDLLPEDEIDAALTEAHRVVSSDGLLCLVGITPGRGILPRVVMGGWSMVAGISPRIVGGCRPVRIAPRLDAARWAIRHHDVVAAFGIASEILVAERRA